MTRHNLPDAHIEPYVFFSPVFFFSFFFFLFPFFFLFSFSSGKLISPSSIRKRGHHPNLRRPLSLLSLPIPAHGGPIGPEYDQILICAADWIPEY